MALVQPRRETYVLHLRPEPGVDPVRALRAALKALLRRYGLRVISVHEETEPPTNRPP